MWAARSQQPSPLPADWALIAPTRPSSARMNFLSQPFAALEAAAVDCRFIQRTPGAGPIHSVIILDRKSRHAEYLLQRQPHRTRSRQPDQPGNDGQYPRAAR